MAVGRTYGKIVHGDGCWLLSEVEPHVAIRLKQLFPAIPKTSKAPFRLPATPLTGADLAWFLTRYPMAGDPGDLDALERAREGFERMQAEVGRIMQADWQPPLFVGLKEGQAVRPHQARASEVLAMFGGLLVGDEMGEGKTYTGAACCLLPGALPATVVCPGHLKAQWVRKLEAFTTLSAVVVDGLTPYAIPPSDVRIFGYSNIGGWVDYIEGMGTGLVVFDEVHELRTGPETSKGKACRALADSARMRLGMTGTPIFNYGNEIWNLMRFIRPEVLGDWEDFAREWVKEGAQKREVADPKALGAYLREQHAMIRKLSDGPKPNTIVETVDHDAWQLDRVEEMARRLAERATTGVFQERGQATRELDLMMRYQTGLAKARAVAAYCRILLEAGEPIILFGWHREVYEVWLDALKDFNPVMYTGSETPRQKEAAKDAFLSGESQLFIMSLRSGAGVDGLQARASTCVFGELDWSPAMHAQCIGRLNREGQACWPDPVTAIFLVADDGSDPPMQEVLGLKASQAQGVVDPGLGVQTAQRDDSRLQRLVERYLNREAPVAAWRASA
ncbi:MAG: ATP-dependent helicase [Caulobacter sp.]|nr:ATP-dependent helicase [Caulobacter sp.]